MGHSGCRITQNDVEIPKISGEGTEKIHQS